MSEQYSEILRSVAETNEKIGTFLEKMNAAPLETSIATQKAQTVGEEAPARRAALTTEERSFLDRKSTRLNSSH